MEKTKIENRRLLAHKAALLLSDENPILKLARQRLTATGGKFNKRDVLENAYPSLTALGRWSRMEVASIKQDSLDKLVNAGERCGISFTHGDFLDSGSKYELGRKLGFNHTMVQKVVDTAFLTKKIRMSGYFMGPRFAGDLARDTRGIYHLYFKRPSSTGRSLQIVKAALRVRYALNAGSGVCFVRCKLHIPDDKNEYFEYDGLVAQRGDHLYWYFDEVSDNDSFGNDMVTLLCDRGAVTDSELGEGVVSSVTVSSDTVKGQIYSSVTKIKKVVVEDWDDREEAKRHMRKDIGVLSPAEFEDELKCDVGVLMAPIRVR